MSSSTHQIKIKAVDKTTGAFSSISKRASSAASSVKGILGGALAAAGSYLGVKAISGQVTEMSKLADTAKRAKVSVSDLTKLQTGLEIGGIGLSTEQLAKAMQDMTKNTGQTGINGFFRVLKKISDLPDPAERLKAANSVFGEIGNNLMPLIDNMDIAGDQLRNVMDNVNGIPDEITDASKRIKTGFDLIEDKVKGALLNGFVNILKTTGLFNQGFEQGMLDLFTDLVFGVKIAIEEIKNAWEKLQSKSSRKGEFIGDFAGTYYYNRKEGLKNIWRGINDGIKKGNFLSTPYVAAGKLLKWSSWDWMFDINKAWKNAKYQNDISQEAYENYGYHREMQYEQQLQALAKLREEEKKRNRELIESLEKLRGKTQEDSNGKNQKNTKEKEKEKEKEKKNNISNAKQISNSLILSGSAQALKMSILGPQALTNKELKKQTELLQKINKNTEDKKKNSEASLNLGELN